MINLSMFPFFIKGRKLRKFCSGYIEHLKNGGGLIQDTSGGNPHEKDEIETEYDNCHLVCSDLGNGKHMPVIDLDFSCFLQESSTEGHYHLYLNREVEWEDFKDLLKQMEKCGLVEKGYVDASISRGYTAVRKPGLKKGDVVDGKL